MFALDTASRVLLAAAAFVMFGAAFVTAPIVARGEVGVIADTVPAVAPLESRTARADVAPRRDPFAGGDAPMREGIAAEPSRVSVQAPPLPSIPAALRALPPNAGAGEETFPFATTAGAAATITAVITGPHPFALVDEAGITRMLTVGDRIDGDPIATIDADGVRLSGGRALAVVRAAGAGQPPSPHVFAPVVIPTAPGHRNPGGR